MIRLILTLGVMAVSVVPAVVSAQDQDETAEWTPSHLADGQPDIQGMWNNLSLIHI